ncbi:mitochondrial ribosomal small subunit component [Linderina pennispora]|nr:mitochondrial ribosomal small subunit component [Linderina pennispora]
MYKKPSTARQIQHVYEKLLDAKLRDKAPAWLKAMQNTPASASLVRDPSYFSTKGQLPFEKTKAAAAAAAGSEAIGQVSRALPVGCVAINHRKRNLKTRSPKPPKIEFPEDSLRREFYKRHPFELLRPRIVMEPNGRTETNWSRLSSGSSQVTGEQ